jgi:hypothetical protein
MEARNHEYPRLRYTELLSLVYRIGRRDGAEHPNLPSYKKQLDNDTISSTTHPFSHKKSSRVPGIEPRKTTPTTDFIVIPTFGNTNGG